MNNAINPLGSNWVIWRLWSKLLNAIPAYVTSKIFNEYKLIKNEISKMLGWCSNEQNILLLVVVFSIYLSSSSSEYCAQGQVLHCKRRNLGCSSVKGRSSTANWGTQVAVLLGMDRCGSFPSPSAPHSLFSIWTDLKRCENIPGAPAWRWGEWIWLTGPSGLHRNSPQGLNISSIRVFDQIREHPSPSYI